jgi:transcriptional regulator with XRE-family HTH domain
MPRSGASGFSPARLQAARDAVGLSPAALARAAGISRSAVSKYLTGQSSPQPAQLKALAGALAVPPGSLLEAPAEGEPLAQVRAAAGLTQEQLADRTGIGRSAYELAELGRRPLSDAGIARIAAATGTSPARVRAAHQRDVSLYRASRSAGKPSSQIVSDSLQ